MHSKSNNIEIMIDNETDEIIGELFEYLLQKISKKFRRINSVDLLHYKCHEISLNPSGSYRDSPKWLKNKKATINPNYNDNKSFQYAMTVALDHKNIVKDLQRISKIKLFINKYNWKEINFPPRKNDMKN